MILRDEGRDFESVEWFHQACAEFEKQASPNLENVIEELEHDAAALTRLNRADEAHAVEERIKSVRKAAAEVPSVSDDSDAPVELTDGALLIELDAGIRNESTWTDIAKLGSRLDEILREQHVGGWQEFIRIPECSTLIYYGSNAEAMYAAIEPTLWGDSKFEGALITIRQRTQKREVMLPRRVVN